MRTNIPAEVNAENHDFYAIGFELVIDKLKTGKH